MNLTIILYVRLKIKAQRLTQNIEISIKDINWLKCKSSHYLPEVLVFLKAYSVADLTPSSTEMALSILPQTHTTLSKTEDFQTTQESHFLFSQTICPEIFFKNTSPTTPVRTNFTHWDLAYLFLWSLQDVILPCWARVGESFYSDSTLKMIRK